MLDCDNMCRCMRCCQNLSLHTLHASNMSPNPLLLRTLVGETESECCKFLCTVLLPPERKRKNLHDFKIANLLNRLSLPYCPLFFASMNTLSRNVRSKDCTACTTGSSPSLSTTSVGEAILGPLNRVALNVILSQPRRFLVLLMLNVALRWVTTVK